MLPKTNSVNHDRPVLFPEVKTISNDRDQRVNEQIRIREVRLIGENGEQLGIMPTREALRLAYERGLDLVEVAAAARPPVCRIMDYGKFKYEQSKKEREARKRQKTINIKEVRMTPKIEEHDFDVKARSAEKFLRDGDKVKVSIRFRGREIVHSNLAHEIMMKLADEVKEVGAMEREPRVEGRSMIMILSPKE
ncbi:MAG: translation initiation factor IF-3 [Firmicutes bacterium]|nr:translation initiation factor IF-3 [Bacillota bacterium]